MPFEVGLLTDTVPYGVLYVDLQRFPCPSGSGC
jgi:hypothetical protein